MRRAIAVDRSLQRFSAHHSAKLQMGQFRRADEEMHMPFNKTRNNRAACRIDHLRAGRGSEAGIRIAADRNDGVAINRNRLRCGRAGSMVRIRALMMMVSAGMRGSLKKPVIGLFSDAETRKNAECD